MPYREVDECHDDGESTALPTERRQTESSTVELPSYTAQQSPVVSQGNGEVIQQKPLALDMSANFENDEEAKMKPLPKPVSLGKDDETCTPSLIPEASATLRYDDETRQKMLTSDWILTLEHFLRY